MIRILILVFVLTNIYKAQTDWEYWHPAEPSYVHNTENTVMAEAPKSTGDNIISAAKSLYGFFISDLDGDNCPFHPTCSEFFVQSARRTNLIKSVLMFTDRFTRDINLGKGTKQYLLSEDGHFFDPVENYLLVHTAIHNIPLQPE